MRNLSIVVPAYNEAKRIPSCLAELARLRPVEIIVVENGSTDTTAEIVQRWIKYDVMLCNIRLIHLQEPGKGAAVRTGMLAAKGDYLYMADCDLSTPASAVLGLLTTMRCTNSDIILGSRRVPGARVTQSPRRALSGRIFSALTHQLLPDIKDTQCGFKLFKRQAAQTIFSNVSLDGLAFDVEILLEARRLGYKVTEAPVRWVEDPDSRVRLLRDSYRMVRDLLSLARRYRVRGAVSMRPSLLP